MKPRVPPRTRAAAPEGAVGEAEVNEHHAVAVARHDEVRGLEVAVHHAEAVQRAQGLRGRAKEGLHPPRVGAPPEGLVEGRAVDEFAGEEGPAGVFGVGRGEAEIVHPRDRREVELREDLELVHQPLRERRLGVREQALEHHDGAAREAVLDEPDAAAAAFSHPSEHPVTVR